METLHVYDKYGKNLGIVKLTPENKSKKIAYGFDLDGFYTGEIYLQKGPMGEGYLVPGNCTFDKPSKCEENKKAKWDGNEWEIVDDPEYLRVKKLEEEKQKETEEEEKKTKEREEKADKEYIKELEKEKNKREEEDRLLKEPWVIYNKKSGIVLQSGPLGSMADNMKDKNIFYEHKNIKELKDIEAKKSESVVETRNEYGVFLKKMENGKVIDRNAEEVEKETFKVAKDIEKSKRDSKLRLTDFTQLPDADIDVESKENWKFYRQALRDMDFDGDWPTAPKKPVIPGVNDQ